VCSVARLFITRLQCRVTFYDPISAPTQTLLILGAFHYSTLAEWGSWRNYENSNFGLSQQDPQPFFFLQHVYYGIILFSKYSLKQKKIVSKRDFKNLFST